LNDAYGGLVELDVGMPEGFDDTSDSIARVLPGYSELIVNGRWHN
jgi:hypothetical protein